MEPKEAEEEEKPLNRKDTISAIRRMAALTEVKLIDRKKAEVDALEKGIEEEIRTDKPLRLFVERINNLNREIRKYVMTKWGDGSEDTYYVRSADIEPEQAVSLGAATKTKSKAIETAHDEKIMTLKKKVADAELRLLMGTPVRKEVADLIKHMEAL